MVSHAVGRGLHVADASAAPHIWPISYAQYSLAVHVLPSQPPQPLGGPASMGGQGVPLNPPQPLQPARLHSQAPCLQVHRLQSTFFVSPSVHSGGGPESTGAQT